MEGKLISRRTALKIGGSLALAAAHQNSATGQGARPAGPGARIIDVHHHYFAPVFVARRREQILESGGTNVISWMPQTSLDQMDAAGVTTAILSSAGPGVWYGKDSLENNRAMAREMNEFGVRLATDHPGRYGLF